MKFELVKRYRKSLFNWIVFMVMFNVTLVLNGQFLESLDIPLDIYTILTQDFMIDLILIFSLIPILSIVALFLGGYLFTPLLIFFHKKFIGRTLVYGIEEHKRPMKFKGAFLKSLFPALMAFNIAILLSDEKAIQDFIFTSWLISGVPSAVLQILTILILLPLVSAIAIAAFSAAFFLIDSGIGYTNKKQMKVKNGSYPIEVSSVGTFYLRFLKGYAGISVVISIVQLLYNYITSIQDFNSAIYLINLIMWPFMPFCIAYFMVPAVIIQDATYNGRNKFVRKRAKKFGISGRLEDPLGRNQ